MPFYCQSSSVEKDELKPTVSGLSPQHPFWCCACFQLSILKDRRVWTSVLRKWSLLTASHCPLAADSVGVPLCMPHWFWTTGPGPFTPGRVMPPLWSFSRKHCVFWNFVFDLFLFSKTLQPAPLAVCLDASVILAFAFKSVLVRQVWNWTIQHLNWVSSWLRCTNVALGPHVAKIALGYLGIQKSARAPLEAIRANVCMGKAVLWLH